ncbi:response regulator [Aquabacter sp. L1I39]|uniref:ATP-binding protein n=1 Tax=Aquabacter sp. L1I39 TaxID=2820278 RepID=UPI001ADA1AC3|nr:ATP-binding protein [Aquabacter sp. L1I39]QTL03110.1 response regulator [Aquabacter sp. L1I39]
MGRRPIPAQPKLDPDSRLAGLGTEQQLRILIEGVRDCALFMLDVNGRVCTWNPGAERIKGYSTAEIIGAPYAQFFTPEDVAAGEPARALATAALTGKYEKEGWRVRKNGERFFASVLLDAVHDTDGVLIGYAKVTRDITERRNAQLALEETREALFQAQKMEAVGQLTGGIAHDFNNVLAGIMGSLELLRARIAAGRIAEADRYVELALTAAERAGRLTQRLLAFGRRQPLKMQAVDVNDTLVSMQDMLARTLGEGIAVTLHLSAGLPPAWTDPNQLENAVLNLALNSRDAMPAGGRLSIATALETDRDGKPDIIALTITDSGEGMSPEVLARAFEPFFTTKPFGQGTGLGLSMIHGFAKQSGGNLTLTSSPGAGTQAILHLCVAEGGATRPAPAGANVRRGHGERLLLVEDEPQVRQLVAEILTSLGYEPITAEDGREALAHLGGGLQVRAMVTDIGLPGGMDGRQLADFVRQMRPGLPVLFITGYAADAAQRPDFIAEGMDLLVKPFTTDTLAARLQALLVGADGGR